MSAELKQLENTFKVALDELNELKDQIGGQSQLLEKVEKIEKDLDKFEDISNKLVLNKKNQEIKEQELEEKIIALEKKAYRNGSSSESSKACYAAFQEFLLTGKDNIEGMEYKTMRTDSDPAGGYLVPKDLERSILKNVEEMSPIRNIARVTNITTSSLELPKRNTIMAASWVGEAVEGGVTENVYGKITIALNTLQATVPMSRQLLLDAGMDMEAEVSMDAAEAIAIAEGTAFVNGNGVSKPTGIMTDAVIATSNSGVANSITFDSIITVSGLVKSAYNPIYGFNRLTRAIIRKLKGGDGQYLWQAGNVAAGIPNTINGYNYIELPDMPNVDTNLYPVIFGDFNQGYRIVDRDGITVITDPYSRKKEGIIEMTFYKRIGGKVVKPEAFAKIKCAV